MDYGLIALHYRVLYVLLPEVLSFLLSLHLWARETLVD